MNKKTLFLSIIERYVHDVVNEIEGVRQNEDIEPLHRMRVALRRLSGILDDQARSPRAQSMIKKIARWLSLLGKARDLDTKIVFLKGLAASLQAQRYREGINAIMAELICDRKELQSKIDTQLLRMADQISVARLEEIFDPNGQEYGVHWAESSKARILVRLRRVFKYEPYIRCPEKIRELHKMRIAVKELRYILEGVQPLFGRKLEVFIRTARTLQKVLGDMHNFDVWLEMLRKRSETKKLDAAGSRAIAFLKKESERLREASYEKVMQTWVLSCEQKVWAKLGAFVFDRP